MMNTWACPFVPSRVFLSRSALSIRHFDDESPPFFGVNASGAYIALFGGVMAPINFAASACVLWVMASPAVAQNSVVLPALYYFHITIGGVGFAVPMALFMAG